MDAVVKINGVTISNITAKFTSGVLDISLELGIYEVSQITICSNYSDSYHDSRIDSYVYNTDFENNSKLSLNNVISDVKAIKD